MNNNDNVITDEKINRIRMQLAIYRSAIKKECEGKSLQYQRGYLYDYLKSLMKTNFVPVTESNFDQLKDIVEDFLISCKPVAPLDVSKKGWAPWLTEERKKSIKWQYSNRYLEYLSGASKWNASSVDSLDICTDDILNHCGDPLSKNDFDVKGLVIGDIQSGKTANYTSLINKALDAGYQFIFVLTGTTNDLRSQTQKRLDKEVAGFKTDFSDDDPLDENYDPSQPYGVTAYGQCTEVQLEVMTNASKNGDLKNKIGLVSSGDKIAHIAIIKKNPTSLKAAIKLLQSTNGVRSDPENKFPYPVLVIDDEADLASPNTHDTSEWNSATKTNHLIRTILFKTCRKFTYVGYTATPFANIFIAPHDKATSEDDVDDIFPDDFIITLPTPPGYSGVRDYFGITENTQEDDRNIKTDLFVEVSESDMDSFDDFEYVEPDSLDDGLYLPNSPMKLFSHKLSYRLKIPDSLLDAIMCFLISTGAKISRNIIGNYTMLVNVNTLVRFNSNLKADVEEAFNQMCQNYLYDPETHEKFRCYWEKNMKPVSERRLADMGIPFQDTWEKIDVGIRQAIDWKTPDSVKLIAGTKEASFLDYSKSKHGVFVCVGGQKLSRGLTLEGLSVSYYGRHAQAIDTLLQMGRWFGYRKGWLDLCRVFTTKATAMDFLDAAIVNEGFKKQIEQMHENPNATPRTFGLTVLAASHLLPTSKNKMHNAEQEKLSYSASLSQTITFSAHSQPSNFKLVDEFIKKHNTPQFIGKRAGFYHPIFRNIDVKDILELLSHYQSPDATPVLWRHYIEECNTTGEMKKWTVILSSTQEKSDTPEEKAVNVGGYTVIKGGRSLRLNGKADRGILKIRALTSPGDYLGFFPDEAHPNPKKFDWIHDEDLKKYYTPDNGILVIYVFDVLERTSDGYPKNTVTQGGSSTVGLAIWFPQSAHYHAEYAYANPVEEERLHLESDAKYDK